MAQYIKDGVISYCKILYLDDVTIISPTEQQILDAGWQVYEPPTPTEEELLLQTIQLEIEELKYQLLQTDYIALKSIEGYDCDALYPDWKQHRKDLRDRINQLELDVLS